MKVNKPTLFFIFIAIIGIYGLYFVTLKTSQAEHPAFVYDDHYFSEVKKIFDTRCVTCHACYNSPCQLNLSSYQGVVRGASKVDPYDFPLVNAHTPTRLAIDATTEQQWREKGFFSVLNSSDKPKPDDIKDSILLQLVHLAPLAVDPKSTFDAETSRICPSGRLDQDYVTQHTMPYGFPRLDEEQIQTLTHWVMTGAKGPNPKVHKYLSQTHDANIKNEIAEWETVLNKKDYKHQLSARYFYEHLFLAHINFRNDKNEFFRIVRAKNLKGTPEEIATTRPFDDPKTQNFFYRFKKVTETIVHKNHVVFRLNPNKLQRYKDDFLHSEWKKSSGTLPGYSAEAANAFLVFKDIPTDSRYKFFLENARYFIMSFIKGPVCRGQTALNVINDHFWVMFVDPAYDVTVLDPNYFDDVVHLMAPPASQKNNLDVFNKTKDRRWQAGSIKTQKLADSKISLSAKSIWNGTKDSLDPNALLTVYRHYDSASVLYGAQGTIPKTIWVMDYQIFEDIYYNLVAGYNVFGPVMHQLNTRLYMDISRIESEDMFINFMPEHSRNAMRQNWSKPSEAKNDKLTEKVFNAIETDLLKKVKFDYAYAGMDVKTEFVAKSVDPKIEFLQKLAAIRFSSSVFYKSPDLTKKINEPLEVDLEGFSVSQATRKALNSINGVTGKFVEYFPDVTFLKLKNEDERYKAFSIVRNRFHYNVSLMFFEGLRTDPSKDTLDVLPLYAASYPNYFLELSETELQLMVNQLHSGKTKKDICKTLEIYGVSRSGKSFWSIFDWFNDDLKKKNHVESGIFDLNRYKNACQK